MIAVTVALRDLKGHLGSVRGWALMFFFSAVLGAFFYSFVLTYLESQSFSAVGGRPTVHQLVRAVLQNLCFVLLVALPAFTMGTFAEERKAETFRLWLSAPVSAFQMVLGKFMASMAMMLLVVCLSCVYVSYLFFHSIPDFGFIFTSYLGVVLFLAAHVAFGVMVSSGVSRPILAFSWTLAGVLLMLLFGMLAPQLLKSQGALEGVHFLAAEPHLQGFLHGSLRLVDMGYFVILTGFFLYLAADRMLFTA